MRLQVACKQYINFRRPEDRRPTTLETRLEEIKSQVHHHLTRIAFLSRAYLQTDRIVHHSVFHHFVNEALLAKPYVIY